MSNSAEASEGDYETEGGGDLLWPSWQSEDDLIREALEYLDEHGTRGWGTLGTWEELCQRPTCQPEEPTDLVPEEAKWRPSSPRPDEEPKVSATKKRHYSTDDEHSYLSPEEVDSDWGKSDGRSKEEPKDGPAKKKPRVTHDEPSHLAPEDLCRMDIDMEIENLDNDIDMADGL